MSTTQFVVETVETVETVKALILELAAEIPTFSKTPFANKTLEYILGRLVAEIPTFSRTMVRITDIGGYEVTTFLPNNEKIRIHIYREYNNDIDDGTVYVMFHDGKAKYLSVSKITGRTTDYAIRDLKHEEFIQYVELVVETAKHLNVE